MKYAFIQQNHQLFCVSRMCKILEVSRSSYYYWVKHPVSLHHQVDERLSKKIHKIHEESRGTYGTRSIKHELESDGISISRRRISRLMREERLSCKRRRKHKTTTRSRNNQRFFANILDRNFTVSEPDKVYVSDITYIPTSEGWLYLAVQIDLFSRRVVGWAMSNRINGILVSDALLMACFRRRPSSGLVLHSDRGSQYVSQEYQQIIQSRGFICSMSRRGNCWDNAVAESFFNTLKLELENLGQYQTRQQAKREIFEYIEVFYNRKRRHTANKYLAPEKYEISFDSRSDKCVTKSVA